MYGDTLPYCFSFFTDPHSLAAVESYYTHTHSFSLDPPPTATFVSFSVSLSWPFLYSLACPFFPIQMLIFLPNFLEAKKKHTETKVDNKRSMDQTANYANFQMGCQVSLFLCLVDSVSQLINSNCKTLEMCEKEKKGGQT